MKYLVNITVTYNGTMSVEAKDENEALKSAQNSLNYEALKPFPDRVDLPNDCVMLFGEATADFIEGKEEN